MMTPRRRTLRTSGAFGCEGGTQTCHSRCFSDARRRQNRDAVHTPDQNQFVWLGTCARKAIEMLRAGMVKERQIGGGYQDRELDYGRTAFRDVHPSGALNGQSSEPTRGGGTISKGVVGDVREGWPLQPWWGQAMR